MSAGLEDGVNAEARHFFKVLRAFDSYRKWSLSANQKRRKDFYSLSSQHQHLLSSPQGGYKEKLMEIDDRIRRNADFLDAVVKEADGLGMGGLPLDEVESEGSAKNEPVTTIDAEKVRSTLRQCARDWSTQGESEREACYTPMLEALESYFAGVPVEARSAIKTLVPGAGLGRLAWEVAHRGFSCTGNEFSFHMLLTSHLILNTTEKIDEYGIYPYIHSFSNLSSNEGLLLEINVPDVVPGVLPQGTDFAMTAGDFVEIYSKQNEKEAWNAVLTCFFIDTAKNIVEYLQILHHLLKPGGVWINLGPTLWHFEGSQTERSIELSVEEVKLLAKRIGFELSQEKRFETNYSGNQLGNLKSVYMADFWVAKKL